jgi:hypothetical protein
VSIYILWLFQFFRYIDFAIFMWIAKSIYLKNQNDIHFNEMEAIKQQGMQDMSRLFNGSACSISTIFFAVIMIKCPLNLILCSIVHETKSVP